MISVWIPGEPKGQPRPRAFARKGKVRVYDPATAEGWKGQIALAVRPHHVDGPSSGARAVTMRFKMPRPSNMRRKRAHQEDGEVPHTRKPDLDNLAKAVLDACTQIGIWDDDSQVVSLVAEKVYCRDKGGSPGLQLTIEPR